MAPAMEWGLVTTVKAAPEKVLAFVAHHLSLGCARIWLYFDDPDDPAYDLVADLPQVTAIRCDDIFWATAGRRPDRHQNRQSRNAQAAYRACRLPWLGHIDVDEFLWPQQPIAQILASLFRPINGPCGWNRMRRCTTPPCPMTSSPPRQFRAPLKLRHAHLRAPVLGAYAEILPEGHLSHTNGKSFFRTGIPGLSPRLHRRVLPKGTPPRPALRSPPATVAFPRPGPRRMAAPPCPFACRAAPISITRKCRPIWKSCRPGRDHLFLRPHPDPHLRCRRNVCASEGRLIDANLTLRAKVRSVRRLCPDWTAVPHALSGQRARHPITALRLLPIPRVWAAALCQRQKSANDGSDQDKRCVHGDLRANVPALFSA